LTETFAAVKTLKANSSDCWNLLLTFKWIQSIKSSFFIEKVTFSLNLPI
jgi:hypothetical protein